MLQNIALFVRDLRLNAFVARRLIRSYGSRSNRSVNQRLKFIIKFQSNIEHDFTIEITSISFVLHRF